jgi:hypothetical protein
MLSRFVVATATVVAASLIGLLTGIASGLLLSFPAALLTSGETLAILITPIAALLGLVVGAGSGLTGIRRHSATVWLLVAGVATLLGTWAFRYWALSADILRGLDSPWVWASIVLAATGASVAWIVAQVDTRLLSRRLPAGPVRPWVVGVYVASFAIVATVVPRLLRLIAYVFSY